MNAAIRPKSKFLGNSAASIMEGEGTLTIHTLGAMMMIARIGD
jgi:hypothetical protein